MESGEAKLAQVYGLNTFLNWMKDHRLTKFCCEGYQHLLQDSNQIRGHAQATLSRGGREV